MELTNWVWPWLSLFCKTKLVRPASCWLTEWCHQPNSGGATKARKWNLNFLLMLNDSLSYGLWPPCSSGQSILLLFLWTPINHSLLPCFPLIPIPIPPLIKAHWKGQFSTVNSQRINAFGFTPNNLSRFYIYSGKRKICFKTKQKQTNRSVCGGEPFWLQSFSYYLLCFNSGPERHWLLWSLCSHCLH